LAKKFHKLPPVVVARPLTRANIYTDVLNDLTNNEFQHSKSYKVFPVLKDKIEGTKVLCLLYIQQLKVANDYDLNNPKIPPKFCWEVKFMSKTISSTIPRSYDHTNSTVVDFLINKGKDPIQLILWKVKNNDEVGNNIITSRYTLVRLISIKRISRMVM
jgi:hypothetical protein